jgi:small subunit ribosomal protein S16
MAVKIRLARRGRKKLALYDVVVADARAPRDGRFIDKLGTYNPNTDPASIDIDADRAFDWVMKGAQPTDTVRAILSYRGVMLRKHLQIGVNKGAITQEDADRKLEAWLKEKEASITAKVERLEQDQATKDKDRLAAERKVKEARAEAIKSKAVAAATAAAGAVAGEETPAAEDTTEAAAEDAVPAEAVAEATPAPAEVEETAAEEATVEQQASPEEAPAEPSSEEPEAEDTTAEAPAMDQPAAETASEASEEDNQEEE